MMGCRVRRAECGTSAMAERRVHGLIAVDGRATGQRTSWASPTDGLPLVAKGARTRASERRRHVAIGMDLAHLRRSGHSEQLWSPYLLRWPYSPRIGLARVIAEDGVVRLTTDGARW